MRCCLSPELKLLPIKSINPNVWVSVLNSAWFSLIVSSGYFSKECLERTAEAVHFKSSRVSARLLYWYSRLKLPCVRLLPFYQQDTRDAVRSDCAGINATAKAGTVWALLNGLQIGLFVHFPKATQTSRIYYQLCISRPSVAMHKQ